MEIAAYKATLNGASAFLSSTTGLDANVALGAIAANSKAMVPGFAGKIENIDYATVQESRPGQIPKVGPDGQWVTINGTEVQLAKEGELPMAPTIFFAGGRTMTLGLFVQGQEKSTIKFLGDAEPVATYSIPANQLTAKLLGKTIKCLSYKRDDSNIIERNGNSDNASQQRQYKANCYTFEEIVPAVVPAA